MTPEELKKKIDEFHVMIQEDNVNGDMALAAAMSLGLSGPSVEGVDVLGSTLQDQMELEALRRAISPFLARIHESPYLTSFVRIHGMLNGAMTSFPRPVTTLAVFWFPESMCGVLFFEKVMGEKSNRTIFIKSVRAEDANKQGGVWKTADKLEEPTALGPRPSKN